MADDSDLPSWVPDMRSVLSENIAGSAEMGEKLVLKGEEEEQGYMKLIIFTHQGMPAPLCEGKLRDVVDEVAPMNSYYSTPEALGGKL